MPYCPQCNTEFTDQAQLCADCEIPLVDNLPEPEQMDVCDKCGAEIGIDSDFCPFCGTLYAEDHFSCTHHPISVASGVCIICHKLFCKDCLISKRGKYLCRDHESIEISEGWAVVFKTGDFILAEIVRGKLENSGIATNPRNVGNISVLADGFFDNALGRAIFKYPVKIFVPLHQYFEALEIVKSDFSSDVLKHD